MEKGNPGYNHYNEGRMYVAESLAAYGMGASDVDTYIVNCPYSERELVEAFIRGLESGRSCDGFAKPVERGARAIAFGRGINLSRYLLNTDFVVR